MMFNESSPFLRCLTAHTIPTATTQLVQTLSSAQAPPPRSTP